MTDALPDRQQLATLVAAKLCHDFASPASAIGQGIGLFDDPSMQDMREDAINLIRDSAKKLHALIEFGRVAYGASSSAETFATDTLQGLAQNLLGGGRATLDWQVPQMTLSKPRARALLNMTCLAMQCLPTGGTATITARAAADGLILQANSEGPRARLKPEAAEGVQGLPLSDGLPGQWTQPYWLWLTVTDIGGQLDIQSTEGQVSLTAAMPG